MSLAVGVRDVSKQFKLYRERHRTLKERVIFFRRDRAYDEFWALKNVDFEIDQGTTFGLVGANGSGKSTLLKILAGILRPSEGEVEIYGRLGALLELGAGFHPDLTGRENVYLNASLLGFSRKAIEKKFDAIVDFAELETFIDQQVRHFSSGMYVRLGFAVAVHMEPDILLVDEVLAVGDEAFQDKCLERIRRFQNEGRTIIVVTHAVDLVRQMCDTAALLDHGELVNVGGPVEVVRAYRERMAAVERAEEEALEISDAAKVMQVELRDQQGRVSDVFAAGSGMRVVTTLEVDQEVLDPAFDVNIYDNSGRHVFGTNSVWRPFSLDLQPGTATLNIDLPVLPMREGRFILIVGIHSKDGKGTIFGRSGRIPFEMQSQSPEPGMLALPCEFDIQGSAVVDVKVEAS